MSTQLVITLIATDRPGIVEQVADVIGRCEGNWLESSLSRLGGQFAGILLVEVAREREDALRAALAALADRGIRATLDQAGAPQTRLPGQRLLLSLVANDRRGIIGEISRVLARREVNLDELHTSTENAPMSGERLFHASAEIVLPAGLGREDLRLALEDLSDDIMVEIEDLDG